MSILVTGATGYLGSYVAHTLLTEHPAELSVLVRARDLHHAHERLWQAWQIHFEQAQERSPGTRGEKESFEVFAELVQSRVRVVLGELTAPRLGLTPKGFAELAQSIDSVLHIAASLNRKSAKACFNVNLRGTLEVIKLARAAQDASRGGLRRFSDVSTVAVAGHRSHETVTEDACVRWELSDYDPYARTKKFCEHLVHELLPDVPKTIFRPSIVLGDSRFSETTQFDMVRAFVFLAGLPALPFDPHWRVDIVPADFVGHAIATLHQKNKPRHEAYHLSSGARSLTYREITQALGQALNRRLPQVFLPQAQRPFGTAVSALGGLRAKSSVTLGASLMKVFWPYLVYDTVFDNQRVCDELKREPVPFSHYAGGLYRFAVDHRFRYPVRPWPEGKRLGVSSPRGRKKRA